MTDEQAANRERARLHYRLAAADLLRAARDFAGASVRVAEAAQAFDPEGTASDCAVNGMAESTGALLQMAAHSSPGVRALFAAALKEDI